MDAVVAHHPCRRFGHVGKHDEAEQEFLQVLPLYEHAFGAEHVATLNTCYSLALCLMQHDKLAEALTYAKRAHAGYLKVLGEKHSSTRTAENLIKHLTALAAKV